ncbi:AlpA family transcriptional regulator [Salmonella enterica subsp. enterica serovar Oranienburg]|uniref:helix-turn-helix transcriptional regulator n=1 Tax=Salmonella enterica TaxID=28901 RepID=UPI00107A7064|nr:AlpA family transcriptional regulator [Salmonella enterica]EAA8321591.1 AlpA family transcriptional regulator [Salmonella enterica subsp. enterica]EDT9755908.1 AlpA family transcriptional regulator [Salmonella enterica subsp. enterica serovar Oranienburg]EAU6563365.1 AlpA family transcriptional regulator [Salmonella enterica]EBH4115728.1 AlpA family transcriptional regulator [Salmonella enterica]ECQ4008312.1 AlpA family transcriptional regulator [Salmonella enterica]
MSDRFIRFAEVEHRTGFCRAWIYHLIAPGEFPRPVKMGKRAVSFIEREVDAWIENKINNKSSYK